MLRDFPITGNEGATIAQGYQQMHTGMFVKKGHGLKELDKVAPDKGSNFSVTILHIDSSREDVDYIQFDGDFFMSGTIALIGRGETSELDENNELAFRAMRGEKVARPLPYPSGLEIWNLDTGKHPKAFIHTEDLQGTMAGGQSYYLLSDRYNAYKGHGLLPGDVIGNELIGDPRPYTIVDIIPNGGYDEVVLSKATDGNYLEAVLIYQNRPEDSDLSSDLLAKRNAYISKLQAS